MKPGWVFKIDENEVLVAPEKPGRAAGSVRLASMKRLTEDQLQPRAVVKKGDGVAIIRGSTRTTGTVIVLSSKVHVKTAKSQTVRVNRADVCLFSKDWEKAALEGTVAPDGEETPVAAPATPDPAMAAAAESLQEES